MWLLDNILKLSVFFSILQFYYSLPLYKISNFFISRLRWWGFSWANGPFFFLSFFLVMKCRLSVIIQFVKVWNALNFPGHRDLFAKATYLLKIIIFLFHSFSFAFLFVVFLARNLLSAHSGSIIGTQICTECWGENN